MPLASEQVPPSIQTTVTWTREIRSRWSVVLPPDLCSLHVCSLCIIRYTLPPLCGSYFHPNHLHFQNQPYEAISTDAKVFLSRSLATHFFRPPPNGSDSPLLPAFDANAFMQLLFQRTVQYMYVQTQSVNRFTAEVHKASCNCKVQGIPQSSA